MSTFKIDWNVARQIIQPLFVQSHSVDFLEPVCCNFAFVFTQTIRESLDSRANGRPCFLPVCNYCCPRQLMYYDDHHVFSVEPNGTLVFLATASLHERVGGSPFSSLWSVTPEKLLVSIFLVALLRNLLFGGSRENKNKIAYFLFLQRNNIRLLLFLLNSKEIECLRLLFPVSTRFRFLSRRLPREDCCLLEKLLKSRFITAAISIVER